MNPMPPTATRAIVVSMITLSFAKPHRLSGKRLRPELQNAIIDMKAPCPSALIGSKSCFDCRRHAKMAAPKSSHENVKKRVWRIVCATPPATSSPSVFMITRSSRTEMRRPIAMKKKVPAVIIPMPPSCESTAIIKSPNVENVVPMPTESRPVTHVALVAVKSASMPKFQSPPAFETGRESSSVPMAIATANATTTRRYVETPVSFLWVFSFIVVTDCGFGNAGSFCRELFLPPPRNGRREARSNPERRPM